MFIPTFFCTKSAPAIFIISTFWNSVLMFILPVFHKSWLTLESFPTKTAFEFFQSLRCCIFYGLIMTVPANLSIKCTISLDKISTHLNCLRVALLPVCHQIPFRCWFVITHITRKKVLVIWSILMLMFTTQVPPKFIFTACLKNTLFTWKLYPKVKIRYSLRIYGFIFLGQFLIFQASNLAL